MSWLWPIAVLVLAAGAAVSVRAAVTVRAEQTRLAASLRAVSTLTRAHRSLAAEAARLRTLGERPGRTDQVHQPAQQ